MIWSDKDILEGLKSGDIRIDDWNPHAIQPASYDLRLGDKIRAFHPEAFPGAYTGDRRRPYDICNEEVEMIEHDLSQLRSSAGDGAIGLAPGGFVLGVTREKIRLTAGVAARIEGKSSIGRWGISVHSTAGFIDPGFEGYLTLEITNNNPRTVILRRGMWIAQLAFMSLKTPTEQPYNRQANRYLDVSSKPEPIPSMLSRNSGLDDMFLNDREHGPFCTNFTVPDVSDRGRVYCSLFKKHKEPCEFTRDF